jgi:hypothetical protein
MAVMAVEAVPGAAAGGAEGAAGGASAGAGARPGGGGNPLRSRGRHSASAARKSAPGRQSRPSARQGQGGQGRLAPRKTNGQQGGQGQLAPDQQGGNGNALQRQARRHGPKLAKTAYQRIVIAEFVATMIIIAAAPVLVPRDDKSDTPEEEAAKAVKSLSLSRPLLRLSAACLLFFLLALMASGERAGRVAAAGGALVMLGALLNATDTWTAIGQMFAGASKAGAQDIAQDQAAAS